MRLKKYVVISLAGIIFFTNLFFCVVFAASIDCSACRSFDLPAGGGIYSGSFVFYVDYVADQMAAIAKNSENYTCITAKGLYQGNGTLYLSLKGYATAVYHMHISYKNNNMVSLGDGGVSHNWGDVAYGEGSMLQCQIVTNN